ncbi:hypothetical protein ENUP19_0380G0028 [Entamoeba nuttalli]|uniref:cDENN domain-containing protein n=1 Tax=Entamoeba nuttalli TaxID=412467 RepID=A0ABQ0DZD5_9EUKA
MQYVFIPVLPLSLLTYSTAPMLYIIGVKNNFVSNVYKDCGKMDDIIVLDVDNDESSNELIYCFFHKFFASIFDGYQKYLKFDSQKQRAVFQIEEYEEYLKQINVENYTVMKPFEQSQMCYMFFKEREEQIQQGLQLTSLCSLCSLLKDYSKVEYTLETLDNITNELKIKLENVVYCKFCFEEIKHD